jgi:DNA-binding NtrC family response regulator
MKTKSINKNIYIVDDDNFFNNLFSNSIESQLKLNVSCFKNTKSCLAVLKDRNFPEIIFLDYNFSRYDDAEINGIDFLQEIIKLNPNQQVIMVSGNYDLEVLLKSKKEGANGYIIKSANSMNAIINLLRNYYFKKGIVI